MTNIGAITARKRAGADCTIPPNNQAEVNGVAVRFVASLRSFAIRRFIGGLKSRQRRPRAGSKIDSFRHAELPRTSNEVEIALMCQQLRRGDTLNCDSIVGGIRDDGVAVLVVIYRRKQGVEASEHGMIDLDALSSGHEMSDAGLTEIRREDEIVMSRSGGDVDHAVVGDIDRAVVGDGAGGGHDIVQRQRCAAVDDNLPAAQAGAVADRAAARDLARGIIGLRQYGLAGCWRIVDDRSAIAIVGKFEIRQDVRSNEIQLGRVDSIGHRQNATRKGIVNRAVVDVTQIDLIRAGKAAVPGEIENRAHEGRSMVDLQRSRRGLERHRCGIGSGDFERRVGPDYCRFRGISQRKLGICRRIHRFKTSSRGA